MKSFIAGFIGTNKVTGGVEYFINETSAIMNCDEYYPCMIPANFQFADIA